MKQIKISLRDVYGQTKAYPACRDAEYFTCIAGTKTLTYGTLRLILSLGYTLIEVNRYGAEIAKFRAEMIDEVCALGRSIAA